MLNILGAYAVLPMHTRQTYLRNMAIHRNIHQRYHSFKEDILDIRERLTKAKKSIDTIYSLVKDIEANGANKDTVSAITEKLPNFVLPDYLANGVSFRKSPGDKFSKDLVNALFVSESIREKLTLIKLIEPYIAALVESNVSEYLNTFIFNLQGLGKFVRFISGGGTDKSLPDDAYDVLDKYNPMLNSLEKLLSSFGIARQAIPMDRLISVTSGLAISKLVEIEQSLYSHSSGLLDSVRAVENSPWETNKALKRLLDNIRDAEVELNRVLLIDKVLSEANGFSSNLIDALR